MASLLERRLVIVTGKGGTGKTTVACALGLLAARRGIRTLVAELGGHQHLSALFGLPGGQEIELAENLWSTSIDPNRAMIEWLGTVTGRISARMLASSSTFQYFAAAAPGAKELITMRKVLELCERSAGRHRANPGHGERRYDLVVLDAPATGHALAMLRSPQTFSAIVRAGPMADHTRRVQKLLADPRRCAYVAVAHPSEMAVTETLELEEQLRRLLDRDLDAVFVNGTLPQRFTREEIARLGELAGEQSAETGPGQATESRAGRPTDGGTEGLSGHSTHNERDPVLRPAVQAALRSAQALHARARFQQSQIARLRRQRFTDGAPPNVLTIPFQFVPELDLAAVEAIAERMGRRI